MKSRIKVILNNIKNRFLNRTNNKNSLRANVWLYLVVFSLVLILFLWIFQVVFINAFYDYSKTQQIKKTADNIVNNYDENNLTTTLDKFSFDADVCIEIVKNNQTIYSSNNFNKGCLNTSDKSKNTFSNDNFSEQTYQLINPKFNNKTLVYAVRIDDSTVAFINASLEPLDTTVIILSKQLIIVSFMVLLLSLIIGYFISNMISKPIISINSKAKKLAKGNYDFDFNSRSTIAEIEELANTLNYVKSELQQTEQLRNELLANVSHDLKTPLTMIKGYAEMVRDLTYKNKEKREENLNIIIEETDRLNKLVEDILVLSSMQAKTSDLELEQFDLIDVIKSIIKHYSIFKDTEGYVFELEAPNNLIIKADKKRLEQVIYNLINNAINYTGSDNKVIVRVLNEQNIRVEVSDTGKGIKEDEIPYIWDKYYHSNKKHKRNLVGTGLGLSIVKSILENHNFNYGVISSKGKGTTFYFEIIKD